MTVERVDPGRLSIIGGGEDDLKRYIESDFKIRSGLCPNDCGLMTECDYGQECPTCHFSCNTLAEKGMPS
jgi:hypothetical protein